MSIHEAKVIQIQEILPHPDPETIRLGLVKIWDYQCVVAKDMWKVGDLAVYIEPDTMVDGGRSEFSFLNGTKPAQKHRIKAKRLRGCWSEGLLVPAPIGLQEGDDAWTALELERYVPQASGGRRGGGPANLDSEYGMGGDWESAPIQLPFGKYDVENWKKFNRYLTEGEEVVVACKLHGANSKFLFSAEHDRMYAGSRSGWKTRPSKDPITVETSTGPITYTQKDNIWWQALDQNPWIEELCRLIPDRVVFGEVFGQVQDLKYGARKNQIFFRIFDIWDSENKCFMNYHEVKTMIDSAGLSRDFSSMYAPVLYVGPYSKEKILELTDGQSLIEGADHIREGVVVKPTTERIERNIGRVILKNVSNLYLERA